MNLTRRDFLASLIAIPAVVPVWGKGISDEELALQDAAQPLFEGKTFFNIDATTFSKLSLTEVAYNTKSIE